MSMFPQVLGTRETKANGTFDLRLLTPQLKVRDRLNFVPSKKLDGLRHIRSRRIRRADNDTERLRAYGKRKRLFGQQFSIDVKPHSWT